MAPLLLHPLPGPSAPWVSGVQGQKKIGKCFYLHQGFPPALQNNNRIKNTGMSPGSRGVSRPRAAILRAAQKERANSSNARRVLDVICFANGHNVDVGKTECTVGSQIPEVYLGEHQNLTTVPKIVLPKIYVVLEMLSSAPKDICPSIPFFYSKITCLNTMRYVKFSARRP